MSSGRSKLIFKLLKEKSKTNENIQNCETDQLCEDGDSDFIPGTPGKFLNIF